MKPPQLSRQTVLTTRTTCKLGELILTSQYSELKAIIENSDYDPGEIARIFNGEHKKNAFYVQLMSSTLDCDRLDYLLRDSIAAGTDYGRVDIDYIIRNLTWDRENQHVCFEPKATNAIEHFVTSRYFSYNVTFHKTVMGFELMAKALFYAMAKDQSFTDGGHGGIVRSFDDIERKIKSGDDTFLANFNDEYFWYYLELR